MHKQPLKRGGASPAGIICFIKCSCIVECKPEQVARHCGRHDALQSRDCGCLGVQTLQNTKECFPFNVNEYSSLIMDILVVHHRNQVLPASMGASVSAGFWVFGNLGILD